jgi:hypothetical protein
LRGEKRMRREEREERMWRRGRGENRRGWKRREEGEEKE